ncbi:Ubiquitin carboxyl-terminal hydrolase 34 [Tritrichomonas musculus]|uniref:Ubiquitin carboxyl-terminal hydrolase 34 n=1 Tax=Tritrichomonas musculus TaxID=1915356 RepID=A0ABR2K045_9EUKA
MTVDFSTFSSKIHSSIRRQNLDADTVTLFCNFVEQIIQQGKLLDPYSDKTDDFLQQTAPKVASTLLSSLAMNKIQLQFSSQLTSSLNKLALWAMLNGQENLINNLLVISDPNASYYVKNLTYQPSLFVDTVHDLLNSQLFEQLNDKMNDPTEFDVKVYFSIHAFIFQYCSLCNPEDDAVSGITLTFPMRFNDFVSELDDETFPICPPSVLVIIMNSLYNIFSIFDIADLIPIFLVFLTRAAKCDNFDKQLTALRILNSYASSTDPQIIEFFDEWKQETDAVSTIIAMDLHLEILQASKDLIRKVIQSDDIMSFLLNVEKYYITQRRFAFRLISQIIVDRYDSDQIIDFITELNHTEVDLEFLCFLMLQLFTSKNEDLLSACDEIVEAIFAIGEEYPDHITPSMNLFFKELNLIDKDRNTPNITKWRIKVLSKYLQILSYDQFSDRTCIFLADQFDELRRVSLLQPSTTPFDEILPILVDTINKAQEYYLSNNNVSEAMIRLFYILVLFRNIRFIIGDSEHITVGQPTTFEFFDYALAALMYTQDLSVADIAIDLFSRFFSQTVYLEQSITILHNFCIESLKGNIDDMAKYRILRLIYKTLIDLEGNFELIDFENRRRNHRNDMKGKMKVTVKYGETEFELYAKSTTTVSDLFTRIAMRLSGTVDMIQVTDSSNKSIVSNLLVSDLSQRQPLSVKCKANYKQVSYHSASFALWNQSFTTLLLNILDSTPPPELTYMAKKLLAFLPCDPTVMHSKAEDYLQMIVDAKSDEKFKYLLHCVNHFTPDVKKDINDNLNKIWQTIRGKTNCFPAIYEFFLCVSNEETNNDYPQFIGGRVFRSLFLHDKKSYRIATDLFVKTLSKCINVSDYKLLKKMLINCDDEEWPYLKEIFQTFHDKEKIFNECIEDITNSQLKHKFIIKLLAMYVKDVMSSTEKIEPFLETINHLDNCEPEQLIDVMRVITDLNNVKSHEYFQNHQEGLNKMINLAFKKGSLEAEELILNFYKQFENTIQSQSTSNTLRQFFDQRFDVWNYNSSEHIQSPLGYIGLRNLQSTCYMNSLFQVFNQIPEFLNLIFASQEPKLQNLQWVLASLQKSNRDFIDPSKFIFEWTSGWNGQIVDPRQEQDVNEFFNFIMNDCPESAQDLFKGEEVIEFTGDGYENKVTEQFYSISVEVKGFSNLNQSINSLTEPETVTDFDDGNGNKISVSRLMKIVKCPKILVIQLRRFEYNRDMQTNVKINSRFEFPERLNIISLLSEEKNAYYTLHSIICHYGNGQNNGHYYSLIRDKKNGPTHYDIFTVEDQKWISISDKDVTDLPDGYQEEAFGGREQREDDLHEPGNAYLLFYVLDEFQKGKEEQEVIIGEDLLNTVQKENEEFGTMQTLFSLKVAEFLQQTPIKDASIYYLYNILMHGCIDFKDYINDITKNIDYQTAVGYTDQNFSNFLSIFEKPVPQDLINPFVVFAQKMMEKKDAVQILRRILDQLSVDQLATRAISPLLTLVYSYLKANGPPEEPYDIIKKLVDFLDTCIKAHLSSQIKIDDILLSLAELLKCGNSNRERLANSCNLSSIEENFEFICGHLTSKQPLYELVEQAVKYGLMDIKYFFELEDITDQKLANVLNEKNYILIGNKYPDKINDILRLIKQDWEKTNPARLEAFANSFFPNAILEKEKQAFAIFFLSHNFYSDPKLIMSIIASVKLNVEVLEKIIVINEIQNEETYNYVLENIKGCESESDRLSLIKMNQYLVSILKVNDLFNAIFSNIPSKDVIIPRFDNFVNATRYATDKEDYKLIYESEIFKSNEDEFKKSDNYNEFIQRGQQQ